MQLLRLTDVLISVASQAVIAAWPKKVDETSLQTLATCHHDLCTTVSFTGELATPKETLSSGAQLDLRLGPTS